LRLDLINGALRVNPLDGSDPAKEAQELREVYGDLGHRKLTDEEIYRSLPYRGGAVGAYVIPGTEKDWTADEHGPWSYKDWWLHTLTKSGTGNRLPGYSPAAYGRRSARRHARAGVPFCFGCAFCSRGSVLSFVSGGIERK